MTGREKLTAWRDEMERKGKTWKVTEAFDDRPWTLTPARVMAEVVGVVERREPVRDRVLDRSLQLARKAGCIVYDGTPKRWRWA